MFVKTISTINPSVRFGHACHNCNGGSTFTCPTLPDWWGHSCHNCSGN